MCEIDKRIPIAEETRDRLKSLKRGDETYTDVIEREVFGDRVDPAAAQGDEYAARLIEIANGVATLEADQ